MLSLKEGELVKYATLNEEIEVNLIEDDDVRKKHKRYYYAMFEYLNGFRKRCIAGWKCWNMPRNIPSVIRND